MVQVFARYVLNDTPAWSEELCRYLFVWASFLGACVAMRRAAHLGVDSLVTRLPAGARKSCATRSARSSGCSAAILVWQGGALVPVMASQRSPSMGISLQYVFAAIPIAGALMLALQVRALAGRGAPALRTGVAWWRSPRSRSGRAAGWSKVAAGGAGRTGRRDGGAHRRAHADRVRGRHRLRGVHGAARRLPLIVVPHRMIGGMDSFLLLALPLFVLAGDLMNTGGITERLVGFARALVGHIRGGLGMTTVVSEYLFSGISGSSAADVSAVGSLLIPAMTRAGYRPELAVSIVAAASAMGVLVPPCLMMVVLASLTDLSIAALFMAGFLPAAAMAVLLLALIYVQARRQGLPREPRPSCARWRARLRARRAAAHLPRHHSGRDPGRYRHADEAAVLAVIYALVLGMAVYREIRLRDLLPILINTASLTGMVMLLVGTASVLSWIFASQGVPKLIAELPARLLVRPMLLLLVTSSYSCRSAPSSRACPR